MYDEASGNGSQEQTAPFQNAVRVSTGTRRQRLLGMPCAAKALRRLMFTVVTNVVERRILFFACLALLLGVPTGPLGAAPPAGGTVDETGVLSDAALAPAMNGIATDITHSARTDLPVMVGGGTDQAATLVGVGRAGGGALVSADEGPWSPAADSEDVAPDGVIIGGLIVNETFSVIGARFARAFNDKWTEPEGVKDIGFTITLGENPAPRRGAQVLVEVEGTTLYQGYLRPNRRQIEQAARTAVKRATLYLQKYYEPREVY